MFWPHSLSVLQSFCRASLWHAFGRLLNLRLRPLFPLNLGRLLVSVVPKHGALDGSRPCPKVMARSSSAWVTERFLEWRRCYQLRGCGKEHDGTQHIGQECQECGMWRFMLNRKSLCRNDSLRTLQSISEIWGHGMVIFDHFSRTNEAFFFAHFPGANGRTSLSLCVALAPPASGGRKEGLAKEEPTT